MILCIFKIIYNFSNSIIPNFLDNILSKSSKIEKIKDFIFFYDYLSILNSFSLLKFEKITNPLLINIELNDIISEFLIKKIHFSIISKSFTELEKLISEKKQIAKINEKVNIDEIQINCDNEIERFYIDFFLDLITFIKKCFENFRQFFFYCYLIKLNNTKTPDRKEETKDEIISEKDFINMLNNYTIFIIEKINIYLIKVFTEEKNFIYYIVKSNLISFKFLKEFIEFENYINKEYNKKSFKLTYSVSDIFIYNEKCLVKLKDLIFIQKNFSANYFKNNIVNSFSDSFDKDNSANLFIENSLFEKLKIIIKDNFLFLNAFEKSTEIFSIIYEENYKFFMKEILNFLKNIYNNQIAYFSTTRKINKFNILYLIHFIIKILYMKNKMLQNVKKIHWQEENKKKFYDFTDIQRLSNQSAIFIHNINLLNNKICSINSENFIKDKKTSINNSLFSDGLNTLNNLINLLTKEFKEKSFCQLIELFEFANLNSVNEEKIDTICHSCYEDFKNLVFYIDNSNINLEYEYIIYEIILSDILIHINDELGSSLKKKLKNKAFNHLVDKITNIMNFLISKFKKNEELRKDEELKNHVQKFNFLMNNLKLLAL